MIEIRKLRCELLLEEEGQDLVEYGLLVALLGLVSIVALGDLGSNVAAGMNKVGTKVGEHVRNGS